MPRTDKEVMELLMDEKSPLNKARAEFSFAMARLEQADAQRKPPTAIERRRMEFEAVEKILAAYHAHLSAGNVHEALKAARLHLVSNRQLEADREIARAIALLTEPQEVRVFDGDGKTCPTCGRTSNGEG